MAERTVHAGGVELALEDAGEGIPVVLLHGLTATRRYVVMGSRALERSGHRVIAYDARGHGASSPAPGAGAYGYRELCADLEAVLDACGLERAVLAGASMGAHTLLRFALEHPERAAGLVLITPAYEPESNDDPERLARWDALAEGLRRGGVEGFVAAYGEPGVPAAVAGDGRQGHPAAARAPRPSGRGGRRPIRRPALAPVHRRVGPGTDRRAGHGGGE